MLTDGLVVDRYVVECLLGAGGQASVYRVRHRTLGTLHALKVLALSGPRLVDRFVLEGQVQARLRHPHIVAVTDVFDVGGSPGLLMEYVAGPSLDRRPAGAALPLAEVEALFRGIVAGVGFAHAQGVVHRDLKPANVLLDGALPKVADFGLAKVLADLDPGGAHTRTGTAMGTPSYMAPEQVRDARGVDARADLWSLGCIAHELLTGRRAFDGADMYAIFNAVVNGASVPVERLRPDLPRRWGVVVRGLLEIDRDRRIPDTNTLLALLDDPDPRWGAPTLAPSEDSLPENPAVPGPGGPGAADAPTLVGPAWPAAPTVAPPPPAAPTLPPPADTLPPPVHPSSTRRGLLPVVGAGVLVAAGLAVAPWVATDEPAPTTPPPPTAAPPSLPVEVHGAAPFDGAPDASAGAVPARASASPAADGPASPGPAPRAPASPRPAVPPAATSPVEPAAAPAVPGTLKVNAIPWATVTVDGVVRGQGAWSGELPAGTHRVHLRTGDGLEHTLSVSLGSGAVSSVCWNFELDARCLE